MSRNYIRYILAELPEGRLVSMETPSWIVTPWFYITIISIIVVFTVLLFKLFKNRGKVGKRLSRLGCLRCNKSKGKGKKKNVPSGRKDPTTIKDIPLESFHEKGEKVLDKSCRPDHALSQRYLQEREQLLATTSNNLRDGGNVLEGVTYPSAPHLKLYPHLYQQMPVVY